MGRGIRPAVVPGVVLVAAVLVGCAPSSSRGPMVVVDTVPTLGEWIEIEGRWDVTYDDGDGHALLQSAREDSWFDDGAEHEPLDAGGARWISTVTGEEVWARDDLAEVVHTGDALLVAAGVGAERRVESIDPATGAALWSVPESDLGGCAGWHAVGNREVDGVPWLVLAAPAECGDEERTMLAQLDPATGATEALLAGTGEVAVRRVGDRLAVLTWDQDGARVDVVDLGSATVSATVELSPAEILTGTVFDGRQRLNFHTSLELRSAVSDGVWLNVHWDDPDDDQPYAYTINEFFIDLAAGTAKRAVNAGCEYEGTATAWWWSWSTTELLCTTMGMGQNHATIAVGVGDSATSWRLPVHGDRPNWLRATCHDRSTGQDHELLLAPATDATLRAYELSTGDVAWSVPGADPGTRVMLAASTGADHAVVLSEDADGAQTLQVLRLCSGEVVTERSVEGAYLDGRYLPAAGSVVTVALVDVTLLARYVDSWARVDEI